MSMTLGASRLWRTRDIAVGAKHTTVARFRSKFHAAIRADIEPDTRIGRHRFSLRESAGRTGDGRDMDRCVIAPIVRQCWLHRPFLSLFSMVHTGGLSRA